MSNPDESFVTMEMKKKLIKTNAQQIDMNKVLESIYQRCFEKGQSKRTTLNSDVGKLILLPGNVVNIQKINDIKILSGSFVR